jgi:SprT protein
MNDTLIKKLKVKNQLSSFLPQGFEEMVTDLIFSTPVRFKIVKPRNTKLGDFRAGLGSEKPQITVNGDLNPYSFLITTLHEFAHLNVYLQYGFGVKPHGEEWKKAYRNLISPAINLNLLPKDIEIALINSLVATKASSCSDIHLFRVLKKYDVNRNNIIHLEEIPSGSEFILQGKIMKKGELRRKRYLCEEITTRKKYLVHALSEINIHEKQ